jgi:hypothetical protein
MRNAIVGQFHICEHCAWRVDNDASICTRCGNSQAEWQRRVLMEAFEDRLADKIARKNYEYNRRLISELHFATSQRRSSSSIGLAICVVGVVVVCAFFLASYR